MTVTLTIAKKIVLGFGLLIALSLGIGWSGLSRLAEVRETTRTITEHDFQVLELLRQINQSQGDMKMFMERAVQQKLMKEREAGTEESTRSQAQWNEAKQAIEALLDKLESSCSEYAELRVSDTREAQWRKIGATAASARRALRAVSDAVEADFDLLNRGRLADLVAQLGTVDRQRDAFDAQIDEAAASIMEMVQQGETAAQTSYDQAKLSILSALAFALFIGLAVGVMLQRSITRPLVSFVQLVEKVGRGDLTQRVVKTNGDELGRLGESLNSMVEGLKDLAKRTRSTTEDLNSASAEILASTQQQAASASEQAAAVQQTTTTMAEVSQAGAQVANRAQKVATAAEATSASSQSGLQAVLEMTRAMESIREQAEAVAENIVALSERTLAVGEIIATVNDIAEQSNLLALNAAIEAAAEGETGRRFSVVAREMKNLADQAKEATVQVRSILGEIQKGITSSVMQTEEAVKRVEWGKQQSEMVEATIRQLGSSTEESVQAFEQIVASTNQQQIGFEQVTEALKNMREASEQNAAGTRQLEQAAANLSTLAQNLQKSVERYAL